MDGVRRNEVMTPARVTPRERSERIARALSEAARRLRFSNTRAVYSPVGRKARRHKLISRLIVIGGFVAFVALPGLIAIAYFGIIAANQYQAEARFAVRSGVMAGVDAITSLTGVPSIQIIQDTQVVTNYVGSRAMVEHLQKVAALNEAYTTDQADFYTRLKPGEPIEQVSKYWRDMTHANVQMPGGIVVLTVRAFRPEDAMRLTNAVVDASETLVNDMNDRSRQDALKNANNDLKFAADRLAQARAALEVARNREGILDAAGEREKVDTLLTGLRTRLLELRQQQDTMLRSVSADAPQMRSLKAAIEAIERQITDLQAELTRSGGQVQKGQVLSAAMTRLAVLELEGKVAEQQYASAAAGLERARSASLNKQIYLTTFVRPTLAEEGKYPRRVWNTFLTLLGGSTLWAIFCGVAIAVRGYM